MEQSVSALPLLLRTLTPVLHPGVFAFAILPEPADPTGLAPIAWFREAEGLSVILPEAQAVAAGLDVLYRAAWITLEVHSDLAAVGLTAAVATTLAEAGISCNVVAAACHDHLFVPSADGPKAVLELQALQRAHSERN